MRATLLMVLFASTLFFTACRPDKEEVKPEQKIDFANATPQEKMAFMLKHFTVLGESVLQASRNPAFRAILYSEIEKEFDEDTNVLFSTLIESASAQNKAAASPLNTSQVKAALDAFRGIDGTNYFPQVYIPFYYELKDKGLLNKGTPVILLNVGEDNPQSYVGYKLNAQGKLESTGQTVTEEFAQENEVWVISLNERVDGEGKLKGIIDSKRSPDYSRKEDISRTKSMWCDDGNSSTPNANGIDVKIARMSLKCHNESWIGGGSEVMIRLTTTSDNAGGRQFWKWGSEPNTTPVLHSYSTFGLARWKRDEVKQGQDKELYRSIVEIYELRFIYWGSKHPTEPYWVDYRYPIMFYTIYEEDVVITPKRLARIHSAPIYVGGQLKHNPAKAVIVYPSADSDYINGWFSWYADGTGYPCGTSYSNGCISYSLLTYRGWQ